MKMTLSLLCVAPLVLATGCYRSAPTDYTSPPPRLETVSAVELPAPPEQETRVLHMALREEVDKTCDLTEPHFFYDESQARPQAHPELEALASCLQQEPYDELTVLLVGRADPRGSDEYNLALGKRRAEYVKGLLVDYGVGADRIVVSSDGERQAKGDEDAFSYGYDRRVDVVQIGFSHAPRYSAPEPLRRDYDRPTSTSVSSHRDSPREAPYREER